MIRVGLIGAGYGERVLLPALARVKGCRVDAVCTRHASRAKEIAARHRIARWSSDWRHLTRDRSLDALVIAVPPDEQAAIASAALRGGKSVFCEKPLTVRFSDAKRLERLAARKRVANMVDFELPEIAEWKAAKKILSSGSLGRLRHVSVTWQVETYATRMRLHNWKTRTSRGGGALYAFASHAFHYIEWFLGSAKRLSCKLHRAQDLPGGGDTLASIRMETRSGALVSATIATHAYLGGGHRIEFFGEKGTLVLENPTDDYGKGFRVFHATRKTGRLKPALSGRNGKKEDGRIGPASALLSRFVRWADGGPKASPSFREGARVQMLLDASLRSDKTGKWVSV